MIAQIKLWIVQGEPVWGLSSAERDLIRLAREKMNNCWIDRITTSPPIDAF